LCYWVQPSPHLLSKQLFLGFIGEPSQQAIITLEKKPLPETEDKFGGIAEKFTSIEKYFDNDIFSNYYLRISDVCNEYDVKLIFPAPEKFILKYSKKDKFLIKETPEFYNKVTLPLYIQKTDLQLQWLKNILNKTAEAESIIYDDPDLLTGFILLPDITFSKEKSLGSLHILTICYRDDIKSLRDLNETHLNLLENINVKGRTEIEKFYKLQKNKLKVYVHYLPTYFHFHVHFVHIENESSNSQIEKAHGLNQIIQNIKINKQYYSQCDLEYAVDSDHVIYKNYLSGDGL